MTAFDKEGDSVSRIAGTTGARTEVEPLAHTPGPWETSHHRNLQTVGNPNHWTIRQHEFPNYPYEGQLEEEWGVYPPIGECGPVALVAGEDNARLIAAAPDLLEALNVLKAAFDAFTRPRWHARRVHRKRPCRDDPDTLASSYVDLEGVGLGPLTQPCGVGPLGLTGHVGGASLEGDQS